MQAENYPDDLKQATWAKVKGALPPADTELSDKLKALQKKHEAVTWKLFEPAWVKPAKTASDLEQAFAVRDRTYRTSVFALKKDANDVATIAKKLAGTKGAAKPLLDAVKAIGTAVNGYAKNIDAGVDELQKAYDAAMNALPDEDDGKDEPESALLNPKKLLSALQVLQRDPEKRMQFGFVDAKEKQPPALAMHPKTTGRSLFATLQKVTEVKAGSYGVAWIADKTLILQVDKAFSGLVKKARIPMKAAGFRIGKIVLWTADGTVLEQDDDPQEAAATPTPTDTPKQANPDAEAAFATRLKALMTKLAALGNHPQAQKLKLQLSEAGTFARKGIWDQANAVLDEVQAGLATPEENRGTTTQQQPPPGRNAPTDTIVFKQTRLVWASTRDKVRGELQKLESAILDVYQGDAVMPEVTKAVRKLDGVLRLFDESLTDKLDEVSAAETPADRARLHGEARDIIARYRGFLDSDPLVKELDGNPFAPVAVQATLSKSLAALTAKLG